MLGRNQWQCFWCTGPKVGEPTSALRESVLFSLKGSGMECRKRPSADSGGHAGSDPRDLFYPSHPLLERSGMLIASSRALGLPSLVHMPHPARASSFLLLSCKLACRGGSGPTCHTSSSARPRGRRCSIGGGDNDICGHAHPADKQLAVLLTCALV